ncbi:MAG TPA: inositol-3-phosphate synthase [Longimicrobiaceae bacterium]
MKIWMIGARGTIATATAVGTVAAQKELLPLEGVITTRPPFDTLPGLPPVEEIAFGGCDIRAGTVAEAAADSASTRAVFAPSVLEGVLPVLRQAPLTVGILRRAGAAVEALGGAESLELFQESARDAIARVTADLERFADGEQTVVVNVASTEPLCDPSLFEWSLARFERGIEEDDPRIPASTLYAYAALSLGMPYVNFTPSTGASLPALVEMAQTRGLPVAGRDGKTGETLVKTTLAPMFAIRGLKVEGWYGTNILGNTDGQVLSYAENAASKVASKQGVLERCLGYSPAGDVRIDYFPPLADHKVAWDFIQFRGWGGHRMRMQFTWEGTDAVLAAPLVLDLARLITVAKHRGEAGQIAALAAFFKTPEGTEEMNLHRQYDALLEWAAKDTGGRRGTLRAAGGGS